MTRDEIRNHYRELRKELTPEQCIYYSQQITNNFLRCWMFNHKLIHCFLPIHRLKEVDTIPLIKRDRKSTRLNSSHVRISYAVFCLKKKKIMITDKAHTYIKKLKS